MCNAVCPGKDVDGFHVVNVGRMCLDQSTMLPATPWGVWEIIKRTGEKLITDPQQLLDSELLVGVKFTAC